MSTEKNKALKVEKKQTQDDVKEEANQQGGSLFGTLIRGVLIVGLLVFMLKPYLFDEAKEDDGVSHIFVVQGKTMGTDWSARICASPRQIVAINEKLNDAATPKNEDFEKESKVVVDAEEDAQFSSCEGLLARVIQRELDKVDALASTYRADSEVSKFNRSKSTEWFSTSPETAEIVKRALDISEKTNGAFDVTVAPLVNMYRFGPNKSPLTSFPTDEEIAKAKANVGYKKLSVRSEPTPGICKSNPELTIDLSGVAKGYSADLVGKTLEEYGLTNYMVEVGGEIRCAGAKIDATTNERLPWVLGIQTPEISMSDSGAEYAAPDIYRVLNLNLPETSGALATSGDYHNFLQVGDLRFSHIVDPRTGKPTEIVENAESSDVGERLGSVSVVSTSTSALSCADVDALATAFFVLGEKEGIELANKLNVAVLYLFRSDDSATQLREAASNAFSALDCRLADAANVAPKEETIEKPEK